MAGSPDYSSLIAEAEKAVAGIKDADLKKIAFEKLVTHLLQGGNVNQNKSTSLTPSTVQKKNKSSKTKSTKQKEVVSIVKELNLRPKGKKSFKDFFAEKKPSSAQAFNTVAVYYLARVIEQQGISPSHVYTCYKEVSERPPVALPQSIRDTASLKGFIDSSDSHNLKLTTRGENFVEHDLPAKDTKGAK
jgi:hypothetical protein